MPFIQRYRNGDGTKAFIILSNNRSLNLCTELRVSTAFDFKLHV